MSFWDSLDPRYRLILCDIWGVVHDGVNLYPGAASRLEQWRGQGRCIVLLTNAPRTEAAVERQLQQIGLPHHCWDAVATSGEAGIEALLALGAPVGFFDTVFVSGGIHAGEPFPENFAEQNGLGDWRPVAVVDGLA